ncbi:hypothetical protein Zmor_024824 [Zophobas morio]|jgi:hypothetical protein|uniref:Uncharacterized protein n=1 Tax=Zophobas morio TaxID=2755281 RepID=A0AA38HPD9_9CUCU|nr:hypothetical protein Zmor_024824 [Zophobas morio]
MRTQGFIYFTYQQFEEKPFKSPLQGIYRELDLSTVKENLRGQGVIPFDLHKCTQGSVDGERKKRLLPLVLVQTSRTERQMVLEMKNISVNIALVNAKVSDLLHCGPRAVKCGEGHLTALCSKALDSPASCLNFCEASTADYQGRKY